LKYRACLLESFDVLQGNGKRSQHPRKLAGIVMTPGNEEYPRPHWCTLTFLIFLFFDFIAELLKSDNEIRDGAAGKRFQLTN
jgi:hypothetical protein